MPGRKPRHGQVGEQECFPSPTSPAPATYSRCTRLGLARSSPAPQAQALQADRSQSLLARASLLTSLIGEPLPKEACMRNRVLLLCVSLLALALAGGCVGSLPPTHRVNSAL